MIKYLGSKRLLVPRIVAAANALPNVRTVLDLFSGTSRVGRALKADGRFVYSNDYLSFCVTLARCYVEATPELTDEAERVLSQLRDVPAKAGYFTKTFCEDARYFHPKNGARVDAIRDAIEKLDLPPLVKAIALTSLMEAADRVDSTTGVQMAYLKSYAKRAHNDLVLRLPDLLPGEGKAIHADARETASQLKIDLAYLDPPYNQHSYLGNYHIWETLVRWDRPEAYGVARKRTECREKRSDFNSKRRIKEAFREVVSALNARHIIVSFSNEGYLAPDEVVQVLSQRAFVSTVEVDYKRYVGAQIGIHNPAGERVGKVSHLRNREVFFVASESRDAAKAACQAIAGQTGTVNLHLGGA